MLNHQQRRRLRAWLTRRHDPLSSWRMYSADAERNGNGLPSLEERTRVVVAIRDVTEALLDRTDRLGVDATPMSLCAVLATVGARLATAITGDLYRVQSGRWARVAGVAGGRVQWWERTGSGQDFHAWVVCALPGRRLVYLDPQAAWWEPSTLAWDYADEIHRSGLGWLAHSATTAKVQAVAEEHATLCEVLYRACSASLDVTSKDAA